MPQSANTAVGARAGTGSSIDRFLIVILLLVLAAVSAVVFLISTGILAAGQVVDSPGLSKELLGFAEGQYRVAVSAGAVLTGLGSTMLALRRLSGPTPVTPGVHVLAIDDDGAVTVETEALEALAETAVLRCPAVVDTRVKVKGQGRGPVRLQIAADVFPGSDLPAVGATIRQEARKSLQRLGGTEVSDVIVRLRIASPMELEG